jgi:hypothetical protein
MNPIPEYNDLSFVLVRLLKEPIYREEKEDWEVLRANQERVRHYFRQIGQDLVLDEAEGFAYLAQLEMDGVERIPRLTQRRALTYQATLLLVCLREEFCHYDVASPDATRLTKPRGQLQDMISAFVQETTNQVRDRRWIDAGIKRLVELGFLRLISDDPEEFEVMRIVKAKIGPQELQAIKEKLATYDAKNDSDES